ncbi:uncharacterized protein KD926_010980 [Aspergillus affinis]|uniref:uncharacterized protein n=1 Tax=Aspergillus affinis TaxID=1070780 RepID=UPI0022FE0394|nr:uncharacterized protein KD926_010980 [Aspergillus affinis]KAI9044808.1 hypothetical protein KD926_010980 [Aspergillus affinis]
MPTPARYIVAMFRLVLRDLEGDLLKRGINLKLEDIAEPFRKWARRYTDGRYAKQKGDPGAWRIMHEIYVEMARNK